MQRGDALHDRNTQAAAGFLLAAGTPEALAQPLPFGRVQRRPGVLDLQPVAREAQGHQAAGGRIARRVVQQVAQHHGQQLRVAQQGQRLPRFLRPLAGEVDAPALGQRQAIADGLLDNRRPVHLVVRHGGGAGSVRFHPRQRQHLRHEPVHAVQPG
jgi:hypothetical protein